MVRAIDDVLAEDGEGVRNFANTPWTNPQNGQTYREYTMDRDGFRLLAMGFTGAEAREFQDWVARVVLPAIRKDGLSRPQGVPTAASLVPQLLP